MKSWKILPQGTLALRPEVLSEEVGFQSPFKYNRSLYSSGGQVQVHLHAVLVYEQLNTLEEETFLLHQLANTRTVKGEREGRPRILLQTNEHSSTVN